MDDKNQVEKSEEEAKKEEERIEAQWKSMPWVLLILVIIGYFIFSPKKQITNAQKIVIAERKMKQQQEDMMLYQCFLGARAQANFPSTFQATHQEISGFIAKIHFYAKNAFGVSTAGKLICRFAKDKEGNIYLSGASLNNQRLEMLEVADLMHKIAIEARTAR